MRKLIKAAPQKDQRPCLTIHQSILQYCATPNKGASAQRSRHAEDRHRARKLYAKRGIPKALTHHRGAPPVWKQTFEMRSSANRRTQAANPPQLRSHTSHPPYVHQRHIQPSTSLRNTNPPPSHCTNYTSAWFH